MTRIEHVEVETPTRRRGKGFTAVASRKERRCVVFGRGGISRSAPVKRHEHAGVSIEGLEGHTNDSEQ